MSTPQGLSRPATHLEVLDYVLTLSHMTYRYKTPSSNLGLLEKYESLPHLSKMLEELQAAELDENSRAIVALAAETHRRITPAAYALLQVLFDPGAEALNDSLFKKSQLRSSFEAFSLFLQGESTVEPIFHRLESFVAAVEWNIEYIDSLPPETRANWTSTPQEKLQELFTSLENAQANAWAVLALQTANQDPEPSVK